MTDSPLLRAVDSRGVATLVFNRPEKGNSYNQALLASLNDALTQLGADASVRAIVLRGTGKHFSAGADVGAPHAASAEPPVTIPSLCLAFDAVPKPVIAVVQGACIGGAVAMICCCDVVIAAENAFFAVPEVRLGFAPGPLIAFFLRAMGARSLRRYLLSGERFSAQDALRIGLVHQICPIDGGDTALAKQIDEFALAGPNAIAHAKTLLRRLSNEPISPELLADLQCDFDQRFHSDEATEGRAAFREKRKPKWFPT